MTDTSSDRSSFRAALALSAAGLACAVVLVAAPAAQAGACGDHVGGKRVECKCGDSVVSDTVLLPYDPVAVEPCKGDGLVIMAPADSDGITLNLGGLSLVGRGRGAGVQVVHGGRLGSVIVGGDADQTRAEIVGFSTGIRANGHHALREVRAVDVHGNAKDGVTVRSNGVRVEDVVSQSNGRHGVAVKGRGNEITDVVSESNSRDGLRVQGSGSTVSAETSGNRRNGAVVNGRDHRVDALTSTNNGSVGVMARGRTEGVDQARAVGNGVADKVGRAGVQP